MRDPNAVDEVQTQRSLVHTLVEDVQAALKRLDQDDTPNHRREAIRTMFAAIEGVSWIYREHIRRAAHDVGLMTPPLDLALQEKSYMVGERGELVEQIRFVPLSSMIRMATRLARTVNSEFDPDFGDEGWSNLKEGIRVRNRLTHPKAEADLIVSEHEVAIGRYGFFWFLALAVDGMEAANAALAKFTDGLRDVVGDLLRGDEQTLAQYHAALLRDED